MTNGTRRRWGVSVTPRPLFTPGKVPVSIVQESGWAPRPVWTGAENLAYTGVRSPDRPARSHSLYRLSYTGPLVILILNIYIRICKQRSESLNLNTVRSLRIVSFYLNASLCLCLCLACSIWWVYFITECLSVCRKVIIAKFHGI
jgi:hypothetical protein